MIDTATFLQRFPLEPGHLLVGLCDRTVLRQVPVDDQFVAVGRRKELVLNITHAEHRQSERRNRYRNGEPAPPHAQRQRPAEPGCKPALVFVVAFHGGRQDGHAEQGREKHGDDPRRHEGYRDHDEQREREFAGGAIIEADRNEAGHGHQRAGQHRKGRGRVDIGRGLGERIADLQTRHHHFHGDHGVVHQQTQRDDQRPQRNPLQRDARIRHHQKSDREDQRDRDGDDKPGAHAQADEADRQHDHDRLEQGAGKAGDRLVDDLGLV